MIGSIIEDIKRQYRMGDQITRLILINIGVFVVVALLNVFLRFGAHTSIEGSSLIWRQITLSGDWAFNLTHPWVLFSHMFVHLGLWHILWNMLFLFWFGRRVEDFIGRKHVLPLYIYGGLMGAFVLMVSMMSLSYESEPSAVYAHGASAAVMAFVVAAGVLAPESEMHLILIGPVKMKYIVFFIVLMDVLALGSSVNTGGHFGHLGGALMGWFYIYALRNGMNLIPWLNASQADQTGSIRPEYTLTRSQRSNRDEARVVSIKSVFSSDEKSMPDPETAINEILDKISEQGIDSLTDKEREMLDDASKQG